MLTNFGGILPKLVKKLKKPAQEGMISESSWPLEVR